ncbi:MAG: SUMF1/EgtB/PvdO family nonheme iron enzyme, partial [Gammaproteobacteria bacterium]|nr:SUMF1/EgtB/PvdO family nonheme iron enzyme [Gammaproteobacteria bacterium]
MQTLTLELSDGVTLQLRQVPPGEFRMGSRGYDPWEEPAHQVRITQPFWLGIFPVTQAQYAHLYARHRNEFHGQALHPAENMSWHEAVDFCRVLREALAAQLDAAGLGSWSMDLPSEAQWEYAC